MTTKNPTQPAGPGAQLAQMDVAQHVAKQAADVASLAEAALTAQPFDPSKVRVGDTVTLQGTKAKVEGEVTSVLGSGQYGADLVIVIDTVLYFRCTGEDAWTLTAHQPAPEPEPELKPGTVAVATVNGHEGIRVMRTDGGLERVPEWFTPEDIQYTDDGDDRWYHSDDVVTDVRPLVVIDPADVDVEALVNEAGEVDSWSLGTGDYRAIVDALLVHLGLGGAR